MSSYFDAKSSEVSDASAQAGKCGEDFIKQVAEIESEVIRDITLVVGDREFPVDLREKALSLIAQWHVGTFADLAPTQKAVEYAMAMRMSELVESMHSLFHDLARRRIFTRFGMLDDHPRSILDRRDDHDSPRDICKQCGHSLDLHIAATGCNGHFSTGKLPRATGQSEYCQCGGFE